MNDYLSILKAEQNITETENGDIAFSSTQSSILDLFSVGGACRSLSAEQKLFMFRKAVAEDELLAIRCMFYLRAPRQGQGERELFRFFLSYLTINYPHTLKKIVKYVAEFGRWDDLWSIIPACSIELKTYLYNLFTLQLCQDEIDKKRGKPISLLAKWMPSINTSNPNQRALALDYCKRVLYNDKKAYRKLLSALRTYLNIVEKQMVNKEWNKINYEHVPSKAMLKYKKAFSKHDLNRFGQYLNDVKIGQKKMNMSVTYPHEIVGLFYKNNLQLKEYQDNADFIESAWKSLPNFANTEDNALVVADVSGSMAGKPLCVSISLAMYFAERNKGYFHNHFITFSENPYLQEIIGKNLFDKFVNLNSASWDMNTDLRKVFIMLVDTAIKNKIPKEQFPKKIFIISDMQFDSCVSIDESSFESIKTMYKKADFEIPQVIFWDVDGRQVQVPVLRNEYNTVLISGYSPITFKYVLENKSTTPYDSMVEILSKAPFNKITLDD